jgi:hypothetical protein
MPITPATPGELPVHGKTQTVKFSLRQFFFGNMLASSDEIAGRRQKLSEPNFLATIRIGAEAKTKARAKHLVDKPVTALQSMRGPHMWFRRRLLPPGDLQLRMDNAYGSISYGMQISASEAMPLTLLRTGNPFIPGMPRPVGRHPPAPTSVLTQGLGYRGYVICRSESSGRDRLG